MRLIRRSLLCLVVGVTAFGAAGWGFRPRPNWELDLPDDIPQDFVRFGPGALSPATPIWMSSGDEDSSEEYWLCIDAKAGRVLNRVDRPRDNPQVLVPVVRADGRLQVYSARNLLTKASTRVDVFGIYGSQPELSRTLADYYHAVPGGNLAWTTDETNDGVRIEIVDLHSGAVTARTLTGRYPFRGAAVRNDGLTAVYVGPKNSGKMHEGIEVWDLRAGKRVAAGSFSITNRIGPDARFDELQFDSSGKTVGATLYDEEDRLLKVVQRFSLDVDSGSMSAEDTSPPAAPVEAGSNAIVLRRDEREGYEAWIAERREPFAAWYTLRHHGEDAAAWRRIPIEDCKRPSADDRYGRIAATAVEFVEPPRTLVFRVVDPAEEDWATSNVEKCVRWLQSCVPTSGAHWLDRQSGAWRAVGVGRTIRASAVRGDSFLTCTTSADGRSILQSWPLPPRDPKWPALGVAALCTVGTWWMCAGRYRRRTRLDSVGAQ